MQMCTYTNVMFVNSILNTKQRTYWESTENTERLKTSFPKNMQKKQAYINPC